jgi:hypothetical protein
MKARIASLLATLLASCLTLAPAWLPAPAWAGPVNWQEVPASAAGRQWWDAGSLRPTREGTVAVLSRFQPAGPDGDASRPLAADLYVMEIDCGQRLYRDTSVNGIPRWRAEWQPGGADPLVDAVIQAACAARQDLLS